MDLEMVKNFFAATLIPMAWKVLISFLLYAVGSRLIRWIVNLTRKGLKRAKVDAGVESFLISAERIALFAVLIFVVVNYLGFASSSIIAILGSVGVTVGLALQGSLSNLAGGVLILILKPFRVGDYIVATGVEGTVTEIEIFYTKLSTADNKKIVIPNGALSNSNIVNVSHEEFRRIDLVLPVAYDSDIKKVKEVLGNLADKNELITKERDVNIYINAFADSSINFGFRFWTRAENYWSLKWQMMEDVKLAFDENGIEIPFNQLDVTVKGK